MNKDIMFYKLGYDKYVDSNGNIDFYKYSTTLCENDTLHIIRFYVECEEIGVNKILTMEELQAINEKCKELGWFNGCNK